MEHCFPSFIGPKYSETEALQPNCRPILLKLSKFCIAKSLSLFFFNLYAASILALLKCNIYSVIIRIIYLQQEEMTTNLCCGKRRWILAKFIPKILHRSPRKL